MAASPSSVFQKMIYSWLSIGVLWLDVVVSILLCVMKVLNCQNFKKQ